MRNCVIKTSMTEMIRPVTKLCLHECSNQWNIKYNDMLIYGTFITNNRLMKFWKFHGRDCKNCSQPQNSFNQILTFDI